MQSCRSLQSSLTLQTSQALQDFCKMTSYIQNVTVYTLFVFVYKKVEISSKTGTIFLVKRFPTLSDQVYISIHHVNTVRQDSKGLRLFQSIA